MHGIAHTCARGAGRGTARRSTNVCAFKSLHARSRQAEIACLSTRAGEREVYYEGATGTGIGTLVERFSPNGARVMVASEGPLLKARPGNGGLRIYSYSDPDAAEREAFGLGFGMGKKHAAHGTGFGGAKVVVDVTPSGQSIEAMKPEILQTVSELLNELDGTMYTGSPHRARCSWPVPCPPRGRAQFA